MNILRLGMAMPALQVGNIEFNTKKIIELMEESQQASVDMLVFPELSVTGASGGDLFFMNDFRQGVNGALEEILMASRDMETLFLVGAPIHDRKSFNAMIGIQKGQVVFIQTKEIIPSRGKEHLYFNSGNSPLAPFSLEGKGVEIAFYGHFQPETDLAIWMDNKNHTLGQRKYNKAFAAAWSHANLGTVLYMPLSTNESSTDFVYPGAGFICHQGKMLAAFTPYEINNQFLWVDIDRDEWVGDKPRTTGQAIFIQEAKEGFLGNSRACALEKNQTPFLPMENKEDALIEIIQMQVAALSKRIRHINPKKVVLGISGGLDAALALLIAALTMDSLGRSRQDIIGVNMPGFGSSERTQQNAIDIMKVLGVSIIEQSIIESATLQLKMLKHGGDFDTTYENVQARERTVFLMNLANKENAFVMGTGDMSELALGFATFGGDLLSHYNVNGNIPKTVVRALVSAMGKEDFWNKLDYLQGAIPFRKKQGSVLRDIVQTPISPELLPPDTEGAITQSTEEIVGNYMLIDFFMYYKLKYKMGNEKLLFLARYNFLDVFSLEEIEKTLETFNNRFMKNQFKRNSLTDGPQIFDFSFSPREGLSFPSDMIW